MYRRLYISYYYMFNNNIMCTTFNGIYINIIKLTFFYHVSCPI